MRVGDRSATISPKIIFLISKPTYLISMLQNATKPLLHSRSLEHTDYLKRLGQWYAPLLARLKQLPVEERYLQVRLGNPAIAAWLRQSYPLAREEDVRSKEEG